MNPRLLLAMRHQCCLTFRVELEDWVKVVSVSVQDAFVKAGIVKDLNISAPEKQLQVTFSVNIWSTAPTLKGDLNFF